MGLFDNFGNALDIFTNTKQEDVDAIAEKAGISSSKVSSILAAGLPLILKAINRNNQTDEGLSSFDKALNDHANDKSYGSVKDYVDGRTAADEEDGDKMLGHVFQDKDSIIERLAQTFDIEPAAVKRVLILLVPVLMSYFAKEKKDKNLSPEEVKKHTEEVDKEVHQKNQDGGLFGNILDMAGGNQTQSDQAAKDDDHGLLDSILNMFK